MLDIIEAYIAGCNRAQLESLSKHIIARQTLLDNERELRTELLKFKH